MSVDFYRRARCVVVDMDLLVAVALEGVVREVLAAGEHPDVLRLAADLTLAYGGPVELDPVDVWSWLRALMAARSYLADSLAVRAMGRDELEALVGQLAVDSPVATAARAFLWVGALIADLAPFAD